MAAIAAPWLVAMHCRRNLQRASAQLRPRISTPCPKKTPPAVSSTKLACWHIEYWKSGEVRSKPFYMRGKATLASGGGAGIKDFEHLRRTLSEENHADDQRFKTLRATNRVVCAGETDGGSGNESFALRGDVGLHEDSPGSRVRRSFWRR